MSVFETNTPAFTSTATGNDSLMLSDEIRKYDTAEFISFLQGQKNLELSKMAIKI